ncbi:hypothetical protein ACSQ67_015258 [Phaseolus vulgaris]
MRIPSKASIPSHS